MSKDRPVIQRMMEHVQEWEQGADKRAVFLRCYSMMTNNMLSALEEKRFHDNVWVDQLLHRFADYYFEALACFDCGDEVPLVWQEVHEAAKNEQLHVLQHLLLGVNAHINYDLVLTLYDLLKAEWENLSPQQRQLRYEDHCLVNTIIGETIDQVQDEVVEQYDARMDWVDQFLGRLDERLLLHLIRKWRTSVWEDALELIACSSEKERCQLIESLEKSVRSRADWLDWQL